MGSDVGPGYCVHTACGTREARRSESRYPRRDGFRRRSARSGGPNVRQGTPSRGRIPATEQTHDRNTLALNLTKHLATIPLLHGACSGQTAWGSTPPVTCRDTVWRI